MKTNKIEEKEVIELLFEEKEITRNIKFMEKINMVADSALGVAFVVNTYLLKTGVNINYIALGLGNVSLLSVIGLNYKLFHAHNKLKNKNGEIIVRMFEEMESKTKSKKLNVVYSNKIEKPKYEDLFDSDELFGESSLKVTKCLSKTLLKQGKK
jgi:hypothetical protein